jgi:Zn-dependent metalloprotease
LVTVELDETNNLVSINSAVGEPNQVSPVARISPAEALKAVEKHPGYRKHDLGKSAPRLNYYFDQKASKWRLVFIVEDVSVTPVVKKPANQRLPHRMDYIVDAHGGRVVAELPRTATAILVEAATDGFGKSRQIRVQKSGKRRILKDDEFNVVTFDFRNGDPDVDRHLLPGRTINNPPRWSPSAVSAHANAAVVAEFLRTVLRRNSIDNAGGEMVSSINCVVASESLDGQEWLNAFWNGYQMVYGQRLEGNAVLSLAANIDVVAHEMFHGVTDFCARLEYAAESGALNESYSDIFGTIIANLDKPDSRTWDWELGEGLTSNGEPFRDLSDPPRFGQPDHMHDFQDLPITPGGDWGGVHINSGIHNKAAFLMLTAVDAGNLVLTADEVSAVFYLTLSQQLSRTSQFSDSRRGVLISARTLFRNLPQVQQTAKQAAIEKAFDDVGIQ